jgi:hypothetical protein
VVHICRFVLPPAALPNPHSTTFRFEDSTDFNKAPKSKTVRTEVENRRILAGSLSKTYSAVAYHLRLSCGAPNRRTLTVRSTLAKTSRLVHIRRQPRGPTADGGLMSV